MLSLFEKIRKNLFFETNKTFLRLRILDLLEVGELSGLEIKERLGLFFVPYASLNYLEKKMMVVSSRWSEDRPANRRGARRRIYFAEKDDD